MYRFRSQNRMHTKKILSYLACSSVHCPKSTDALVAHYYINLFNQANWYLQDIRRSRAGSCTAWKRGCDEYVLPTTASILHLTQTLYCILVVRSLSDSSRVYPPTLVQYDQWGRRIDYLETSEGWRELKAISQREGLPGIFYERKYNEYSRIYGFAKVALLDGDTNEVRLLLVVLSFMPHISLTICRFFVL
jgi:Adaptive response protein AidB N-terminal domain